MRCKGKVTIYNRLVNPESDFVSFHRTVLSIDHIEKEEGKQSSGDTNTSLKATIFIPLLPAVMKAQYIPPEEYKRISDEEADFYFTFSEEDVVYEGEVNEEIPPNGLREFVRKHPRRMIVKQCALNDFGSKRMQHFEVVCSEIGG